MCDKCYNWLLKCVMDKIVMNWEKDKISGMEEDYGQDEDEKI